MILRVLWFVIIVAIVYVVLKNVDLFLQNKIEGYKKLRRRK